MVEKPSSKTGASRLKKIFKRTAIAGAAVLALAGVTEWTGYALFDGKDGKNILCDFDSDCRYLTAGEKQFARDVFGDAIDPDRVKIFYRPWMGIPGQGKYPTFIKADPDDPDKGIFGLKNQPYSYTYISPNGNIYINSKYSLDDYSTSSTGKDTFVHELTHVFQHQSGKNIVIEALKIALNSEKQYTDHYRYDLRESDDFEDMNIEQQAELVESLYRRYRIYRSHRTPYSERKLRQYAEILAPHIPAAHTFLEKAGLKIEDESLMELKGKKVGANETTPPPSSRRTPTPSLATTPS